MLNLADVAKRESQKASAILSAIVFAIVLPSYFWISLNSFNRSTDQLIRAIWSSTAYAIAINDSFQVERTLHGLKSELGLQYIHIVEDTTNARWGFTAADQDIENSIYRKYQTFQLPAHEGGRSFQVSTHRVYPYYDLTLNLIVLLLFLFLFHHSLKRAMNRLIKRTVHPIEVICSQLESTNNITEAKIPDISEFQELVKKISEYETSIEKSSLQIYQLKINSALADIAAQVAHDIRSPLSVLKSYTKDLPGIPVDQSQAIQISVNRIGDILTDLERGKKSQVSSDPHTSTQEAPEKVLVLLAAEQIVAEKRFQYASRPEIAITTKVTTDISACVSVQQKEFSRVLSNLIDNAVQAIPTGNAGTITIAITNKGIEIIDSGAGIPEEVLPKLFEKGATFGKSDGTGLGLFHAKQMINSWNGNISLTSTPGSGTKVTLQLPLVSPPDWLCPNLNLSESESILILDDDPSVHQFWLDRLKGKQLFHAYTFPQAREFLKELPERYFVDYEIKNDSMTGFDLIRELGISENAVLITSHYNERDLQERCIQIGLKMIPKPLLAQIEITL